MKVEKTNVRWVLRLYVAGMTPAAKSAVANIKTVCEAHLESQYSLEVIDLLERPALAEGDQILAVPTLVRELPSPLRKIIGDLSNQEKLLVDLDLRGPQSEN